MREITTPLRLDTSNILEEEPRKHDDGWVLETDDEVNEEDDLGFDNISENIINKAMESSSDTESSENTSSEMHHLKMSHPKMCHPKICHQILC